MASLPPYFPSTDAGSLAFMQTFRNNIALDPPRFGLAAGDSAQITLVVDAYEQAYQVAINDMTRTAGTIAAKDQAKATAMDLVREYAIEIKYNSGVSVEAKEDIGVRPPNDARTPIPVPTTPPGILVTAANQGTHEIKYLDPSNGDSKARPEGADTLQLFIGIADTNVIVTDPDLTQFYGAFTRTPIGVQFSAAENGKQATYYARWAGKDGEFGPWSVPVSLAVAA